MSDHDPPGCDAHLFGAAPSVLDGQCRCLVCAQCGHHTGNATQGHYWSWCRVTRTVRTFHFCCTDPEYGCELEHAASAVSVVVVCKCCGHRAHPQTPLECQWCPEGYCESSPPATGHSCASPFCEHPDCGADDRYAELQAESLAAADLDPRWPADDT